MVVDISKMSKFLYIVSASLLFFSTFASKKFLIQTFIIMKRLESLDALRGFDMLFISGGASLLIALAALFPDNAVWQVIDEQMRHVSWDGLRHHDTIFTLFLFIAGISWPFSLAAQRERGASCGKIYL